MLLSLCGTRVTILSGFVLMPRISLTMKFSNAPRVIEVASLHKYIRFDTADGSAQRMHNVVPFVPCGPERLVCTPNPPSKPGVISLSFPGLCWAALISLIPVCRPAICTTVLVVRETIIPRACQTSGDIPHRRPLRCCTDTHASLFCDIRRLRL